MTRLVNHLSDFAGEALAGFARSHPSHVLPVPGGVVRSTSSSAGEVAVVVGGGAGHFPAFAGWVGPGLAHAAVCGEVFASPPAAHVHSVVKAADNGGGVLLGFGNYAGDVLNFGQAADQLRAEGVDVRILAVSDDIASNTVERAGDRRGIAGDLLVFKVAGAAAQEGLSLDQVERVADRANRRTRSLGIAFSGCTLPGAATPLFTVPEGRMAVGLGIHGEPGISESALGTAQDVADLLVDGVLAEEPEVGADGYERRVAVLLNGLGAVTPEELFLVYGRVADRLEGAGLDAVHPEVGHQVSSLDMMGISLTVMYLDTELERLWCAPADTPSFHRGGVMRPSRPRDVAQAATDATDAASSVTEGAAPSRETAGAIAHLLGVMADSATEHEQAWGDLDAVAGDGDHGRGMVRGVTAAVRRAREVVAAGAGAQTTLGCAGAAWSEAAGGTSGALWGAALSAAGADLGDDHAVTTEDVVEAVRRAVDAVVRLGGAKVGDKTMVDAMVPFAEALAAARAEGAGLRQSWSRAAAQATQAARSTAGFAAGKGRARTHADRSLGHTDPGATSFAVLMTALAGESSHPSTPRSGAAS
jgi:dihydroxyacetone kinase